MKVGKQKNKELSDKEFSVLKKIINGSEAKIQFFEHKHLQKLFRGDSKGKNLSNVYLPSLVRKGVLNVFKRASIDGKGYVNQWRLPDLTQPHKIAKILNEYLKRSNWDEFKDSLLFEHSADAFVSDLFMDMKIKVYSPSFLLYCLNIDNFDVDTDIKEIYLSCLLRDAVILKDNLLHKEYKLLSKK